MVLEECQVLPGRGQEVRECGVGLQVSGFREREEYLCQSRGGQDKARGWRSVGRLGGERLGLRGGRG